MSNEDSGKLDETEEFQILVEILNEHGPWCVFGDLAVICWTMPQHSLDASVVVAASVLPDVRDNLIAAGFAVEEYPTYLYARLPRGQLQIQVMAQFRHQGFCERAKKFEVLGQVVPVASLTDVIREKIWSWRDEKRLAFKREQDETDLVMLLIWYPEMRFMMPEEIQSHSDQVRTELRRRQPMSAVAEEKKVIKGGAFLIEERMPEEVFTPEDFTEEHRMIADTTRQFVDNEVSTRIDELEKHDWKLARELVGKAADLGLIGANIPEEYGGLGLDQTSGALVGENIGRSASFATTLGAESGIGLLPIIYFATEAAKQKYLPKIASGELITAYALTEAGSGSDAMAAKATARLSDDGTEYILNGEKMWITNGGFADIFIVFAKVDGDKFSAFIVERQPGLTSGAEEHKMGIKGSSTTALVLSDVRTPVENLLGEIGKGHKIAFNVLNIGRFKLGAMCIGGMKLMVHESVRYANERHQFGKSISSFGAIKAKLAEQAIKTWVGESMIYRTLGMIEAGVGAVDPKDMDARLRAIEEYAAECSIIKVALSEYCDYVVDEMVQIYGGYGYSADYPAERAYRDSRINRIFEGTNEINRMLIPGRLMKSALSGRLALLPAAQALMDEVLSPQLGGMDDDESVLAAEQKLVQNAKKVALMTLGTAAQKYMMKLGDQQEILMGIADVIMDTYAMESAILRARKLAATQGEAAAERYLDITRVFCNDAVGRIESRAKSTLAGMSEGDELRTLLAALRRFTKLQPMNTIVARQRIADDMITANKYVY
jgi:alkylation response protein AidB-like acyl-CoA dehydrogenase